MRICIIAYHYVRDLKRSRFPEIKGLDAALFKAQLAFLKATFTIVSMDNLLEGLHGGNLPDNAVLLTFDDGYLDHYTTVFPILDDMGIQGSFFPPSVILQKECLLDVNKIHLILASSASHSIYEALVKEMELHRGSEYAIPHINELIHEYAVPTRFDSGDIMFIKKMLQTVLPKRLRSSITDKLFNQFVGVNETLLAKELYCDTSQLAAMKRHGMFIGIHGSEHDRLGSMGADEAKKEINSALDFMNSIGLVDKNAWVICYPYGSYNAVVVDYLRTQKCIAGLTTLEAGIANLEQNERLLLPRLDTNDFPPKSEKYAAFYNIAKEEE